MCGFLLTNKKIQASYSVHETLKNRGPDETKIVNLNGMTFIHTLLSMTGEHTAQPFVVGDKICLFNGEIYNYLEKKQFRSDGYAILDSYEEKGVKFIEDLDGEYAIVIVDLMEGCVLFCTDIFGIKPLYMSIEGDDFIFCSSKESIYELGFDNIIRCQPNSLFKMNLSDLSVHRICSLHEFDLRQHKNSFEDWNVKFIQSISKRFQDTGHDIILPLSSGHDSGAIACAFDFLGIEYYSYSFYGTENRKILDERIEKKMNKMPFPNYTFVRERLEGNDRINASELLKKRCTSFSYGPDLDEKNHKHKGFSDPGALGLTHILNHVKIINKKIKILASGQGGDEVTTNLQTYKFGNPNPSIFPKNLSSVFPWENFYYGAQSSYLSKEESISGGFGIEGRYPLLDKDVVQEFLWLTADLKNSSYKAPITNFLKQHKYPHSDGDPRTFKRGFNV